jgi:hypothetical protein
VDLGWFSGTLNPALDPGALTEAPRPPAAELAGRVFSYRQKDVWDHFIRYEDYGPATSTYTALLGGALTPNAMLRFGMAEASGYEPVPLRAMTEMDRLARQSLFQRSERIETVLGTMNVAVLAAPSGFRHAAPVIPSPGWRLWFPVAPAGRYRDGGPVVSTAVGLADLARPDMAPQGGLLTVTEEGKHLNVTNRSESARWLFRSEAFHPGWKAIVGGAPTEVRPIGHAFQGVAVPPGEHTVQFEYRPAAFILGGYITFLSLGVIAAGLAAGASRRRRRASGAGFRS